MIKKAICKNCKTQFEYEYTIGTPRQHCSDKCREEYKKKLYAERYLKLPPCKTDGCNGKATRQEAGLCEACYMRLYRHGSTDKREPKGWTECSNGYIVYFKKGHPLAGQRGMIRAHRYIAYEHYGSGEHRCAYCGKVLSWSEISIDYFNNNKQDNDISNLIISCNKCNRLKGSATGFADMLTDDGLRLFIKSLLINRE